MEDKKPELMEDWFSKEEYKQTLDVFLHSHKMLIGILVRANRPIYYQKQEEKDT